MTHMDAVRTICCKLDPTPDQFASIDATLDAFANACNHAADVANAIDSAGRYAIHHACYRELRERFGLPANLAVRAIARACIAVKVPEKADSEFRPTSIDFDVRTFRFHEADGAFGLTLLGGRERIGAILGGFQVRGLAGRDPTGATLVKRHDGSLYLHVQIRGVVPGPGPVSDFLGVDLGLANIATDSDGGVHSGRPVEDVRRKNNLQRKRLQRKGTKGAKKKLRRLRGKEARFRRHVNHVISKGLVGVAQRTGRGIALEKLKGIRERASARGADARNRLSGWSFHQLRGFLAYKAEAAGVPLVDVDPRYTSQDCSECGHRSKSNRVSQSEFRCKACGHEAHADVNAARNIRARAASKSAPGLAGRMA